MEGNSPVPPPPWAPTVKQWRKQPEVVVFSQLIPTQKATKKPHCLLRFLSQDLYTSVFLGILNFLNKTVKIPARRDKHFFPGRAAGLNRRHWKPAHPS